jgi:hypothetical protein
MRPGEALLPAARKSRGATIKGWSGKRIYAALAIALLIILPAGFIFRSFFGTNSGRAHSAQHLAMEQRLTSNPSDVPVKAAAISADGKYLAYTDPTGLYLRQISSGETRRWSLPKDFVVIPRSWYPDGAHLLIVRDPKHPLDSSLPNPSLYKLSILGGEPQKIMSNAWGGSVSPDGSRIAYLSHTMAATFGSWTRMEPMPERSLQAPSRTREVQVKT